jgi:predicted deacylase
MLSLAALPCALATTFNGDKVNGVPVITDLDVNNLQANRIHHFYLRASQLNSGQAIHVPVMVARGPGAASSGKTIWLSGTIHGDELNPVRVVQKVFQYLDVSKVNGTIVGIPGVNVL